MSDRLSQAFERVKNQVLTTGNAQEIKYYEYHEKRFERMAKSILQQFPNGGSVLDIGSHYLHSSMILSDLGYKVYSVDVSEFWSVPFLQERISKYSLTKVVENDLETFNVAEPFEDYFDLILFTEIFEHITFNPVGFWNKVYKVMKSGSMIYLTTPNAFALPSFLRSFKNLITFKGIGINVKDVFNHVTYGHHWKEYSRREVKEYFEILSDDFKVESKYFSYQKKTEGSFRDSIWQSLILLGHKLYFFAPNLEVLVWLNKKEGIKKAVPKYF